MQTFCSKLSLASPGYKSLRRLLADAQSQGVHQMSGRPIDAGAHSSTLNILPHLPSGSAAPDSILFIETLAVAHTPQLTLGC